MPHIAPSFLIDVPFLSPSLIPFPQSLPSPKQPSLSFLPLPLNPKPFPSLIQIHFLVPSCPMPFSHLLPSPFHLAPLNYPFCHFPSTQNHAHPSSRSTSLSHLAPSFLIHVHSLCPFLSPAPPPFPHTPATPPHEAHSSSAVTMRAAPLLDPMSPITTCISQTHLRQGQSN